MSASIWKPGEGTILVDAENTNLEQVFTTTSAQTLFTLTDFEYTVGTGSLAVYRNGQRLVLGVDWEETSSTTFTLLITVAAGEIVVANGIIGSSGANAEAAAASAAAAAASAEAAALFDPSTYATKASPVFSGFIQGDFSDAVIANRVLFKTTVANSQSSVGVVPSGSATQSGYSAYNASDPTNASQGTLLCNATEVSLRSDRIGSGSFLPLTIYTNSAERLRIGTSGQLGIGGENYGTAGQVLTSNGDSAAPTWSAQLVAASTAEAAAGTSDTVAITPLKLRDGLNASGSAPVYACRAWVNFNGTDTVAIRASGNVSSVTDNATGAYTLNFTTSMPDRNYSIVGNAWTPGVRSALFGINATPGESSVQITTTNAGSTATVDVSEINVAIFR